MYKKKIIFSILVSAAVLLASCGGNKPNYQVRLKNDVDSASYYIGIYYGIGMAKSDFDDINVDAVAKGFLYAVENFKDIDDFELQEKMMEAQMYVNQFFETLQSRAGEQALKEGEDFLRANSRKSGVVTLPSGLQYKIIKDGAGMQPTFDDTVEVMYHGTLIDGTVFDSSKERGMPGTFNVGQVVPGFSEALTLMKEGSVWEVYIPSELGYGQYPPPGSQITPNSVLIFEMDLVRIIKEEEE